MDEILGYLVSHVKLLAIIGAIILFLKILVTLNLRKANNASKGGDFYQLVESFFKFYSSQEIRKSKSRKRKWVKRLNNLLNWAMYIWVILFILAYILSIDMSSNEGEL